MGPWASTSGRSRGPVSLSSSEGDDEVLLSRHRDLAGSKDKPIDLESDLDPDDIDQIRSEPVRPGIEIASSADNDVIDLVSDDDIMMETEPTAEPQGVDRLQYSSDESTEDERGYGQSRETGKDSHPLVLSPPRLQFSRDKAHCGQTPKSKRRAAFGLPSSSRQLARIVNVRGNQGGRTTVRVMQASTQAVSVIREHPDEETAIAGARPECAQGDAESSTHHPAAGTESAPSRPASAAVSAATGRGAVALGAAAAAAAAAPAAPAPATAASAPHPRGAPSKDGARTALGQNPAQDPDRRGMHANPAVGAGTAKAAARPAPKKPGRGRAKRASLGKGSHPTHDAVRQKAPVPPRQPKRAGFPSSRFDRDLPHSDRILVHPSLIPSVVFRSDLMEARAPAIRMQWAYMDDFGGNVDDDLSSLEGDGDVVLPDEQPFNEPIEIPSRRAVVDSLPDACSTHDDTRGPLPEAGASPPESPHESAAADGIDLPILDVFVQGEVGKVDLEMGLRNHLSASLPLADGSHSLVHPPENSNNADVRSDLDGNIATMEAQLEESDAYFGFPDMDTGYFETASPDFPITDIPEQDSPSAKPDSEQPSTSIVDMPVSDQDDVPSEVQLPVSDQDDVPSEVQLPVCGQDDVPSEVHLPICDQDDNRPEGKLPLCRQDEVRFQDLLSTGTSGISDSEDHAAVNSIPHTDPHVALDDVEMGSPERPPSLELQAADSYLIDAAYHMESNYEMGSPQTVSECSPDLHPLVQGSFQFPEILPLDGENVRDVEKMLCANASPTSRWARVEDLPRTESAPAVDLSKLNLGPGSVRSSSGSSPAISSHSPDEASGSAFASVPERVRQESSKSIAGETSVESDRESGSDDLWTWRQDLHLRAAFASVDEYSIPFAFLRQQNPMELRDLALSCIEGKSLEQAMARCRRLGIT